MQPLFVIPARGGSKGIPGKNIKHLNGKPLIQYSLEVARYFCNDERICVSTDSKEIGNVLESLGYQLPFLRPDELSTDEADINSALIHAIEHYRGKGLQFDIIVLLQPTSPLRSVQDVQLALNAYTNDIDMVVSVCEAAANPFYVMFTENEQGILQKLTEQQFERRQDAPVVYQLNGAVYVINVGSLLSKGIKGFTQKKKIVMDRNRSIDIDTAEDWLFAEFMLEKGIVDAKKLLA